MRTPILFVALSIMCTMPILVDAASHPRGVAADHRIKVVPYDPNNIVVLKARYGYQTQITFDENETIKNVSIGDSMAWLAAPVGNHLFIKPIAESTTNMTVLTNENSYNFQLDSSSMQVSPTYRLKFTYPNHEQDQTDDDSSSIDFTNVNWKYSYTGDQSLAPKEVFDDGKFTYFHFNQSGMGRMPAIFIVDKNRSETLVNYHLQGNHVVVDVVAKQFTLRDGSHVTSIYNDFAIGDWKRIL